MQQLDILRSKKDDDESEEDEKAENDPKESPGISPKVKKNKGHEVCKSHKLKSASVKKYDTWNDKYSSSPHLQKISEIKDKHKISRLKLKLLCDIIKNDNKEIVTNVKTKRNSCQTRSQKFKIKISMKRTKQQSLDRKETKVKTCKGNTHHKSIISKMSTGESQTFEDKCRPKTS
mmetsp:Transcript_21863/g.21604  ORF Transcript_21863/g.21604 Transcript_21863/m.21604 type:complete len:175 (+) Transcript_21863:366-890(+)|eukprot:CAMPEP_0197011688 /NCGR_PEP_ID=MMETSP1380-20130617/59533_1 /TAXON_ID=5936 /ORGANISM="Euplotes crassus, Strain CT5" /LENGTH=174 /DNA_ID=CAMNT_0042434591 /DNA_START=90 /DNA_END=614 /DNA_ORIENTATION=+